MEASAHAPPHDSSKSVVSHCLICVFHLSVFFELIVTERGRNNVSFLVLVRQCGSPPQNNRKSKHFSSFGTLLCIGQFCIMCTLMYQGSSLALSYVLGSFALNVFFLLVMYWVVLH